LSIENKLIYKDFVENTNKNEIIEKEPYFLRHGKLCIRKINLSTYIFSERNFDKFYEIHIINYQREKELSTFISFIKNLEEIYKKPKKIVFNAGKWIYSHLPKSVKQFFKIGYIKSKEKVMKLVLTIKKLIYSGYSLSDIRRIAMIHSGIEKISIRTIAKIIWILKYERITPISHAINYLKWQYKAIKKHGRGIFFYQSVIRNY
jgi:hypothetical protein